jgi:hypothetical protein
MVAVWLELLRGDNCGVLSSELIEAADIRLASSLLSVSSPVRERVC